MESSDEPKPSPASSVENATTRPLTEIPELNSRIREESQAILLLNGGMATAVIVFKGSRGGLGPNAMLALEAFGVGLVFGLCALFFQAACRAAWIEHRVEVFVWKRDIGRPEAFQPVTVPRSRRRALFWRSTTRLSLALSVLAFIIGGVALCIGLSRIPIEDPEHTARLSDPPAQSDGQASRHFSRAPLDATARWIFISVA